MKAKLIGGLRQAYPIIHVRSVSPYKLSMSFLRMQEHYESPNPRFRQGIFSLEQYMDWYVKNQPVSTNRPKDLRGHFTYPQDWTGFNVPCHVVRFFRDFFSDKTEKELQLQKIIWQQVDAFAREEGRGTDGLRFYVIGTCSRDPDERDTVEHEVHHGLFYCDEVYRDETTKIVRKYKRRCKPLFDALRAQGYCEGVLEDEAQTYAITGWRTSWEPTCAMKQMARDLKKVAARYRR